jgi:hypothetical protein
MLTTYNRNAPRITPVRTSLLRDPSLSDEQRALECWGDTGTFTGGKHLYVICQRDSHLYKVGVSRDPNKRAQQLQAQLPHQLDVLATLQLCCDRHGLPIEHKLHKALGAYCFKGEWFRLSTDQADMLVSLVKSADNLERNWTRDPATSREWLDGVQTVWEIVESVIPELETHYAEERAIAVLSMSTA